MSFRGGRGRGRGTFRQYRSRDEDEEDESLRITVANTPSAKNSDPEVVVGVTAPSLYDSIPSPKTADTSTRRPVTERLGPKTQDSKDSRALSEDVKSTQDKVPDATKSKTKADVLYEYYDPGNHWCRQCNKILSNVYDVFEHLHSRQHQSNSDPFDRPWLPDKLKNPKSSVPNKKKKVIVGAIKGTEFLYTTQAFYCSLCKEFSGDKPSAEAHVKSQTHNHNYALYLEDNPLYERKFNLDKAAGLSMSERLGKGTKKSDTDEEDEEKKLAKLSKLEEKIKQKAEKLSKERKNPEIEKTQEFIKKHVERGRDEDDAYEEVDMKAILPDLPPPTHSRSAKQPVMAVPTPPAPPPKAKREPIKMKMSIQTGRMKGLRNLRQAQRQIENEMKNETKEIPPEKRLDIKLSGKMITQIASGKDDTSYIDMELDDDSSQEAPAVSQPPAPVAKEEPGIIKKSTPLDMFLTVGENRSSSKFLPVVQEVEKIPMPPLPGASGGKWRPPQKPTKPDGETDEDLKMLGIEPEETPRVIARAPPVLGPSLPKPKSKMAASTATAMYGMFYGKSVKEDSPQANVQKTASPHSGEILLPPGVTSQDSTSVPVPRPPPGISLPPAAKGGGGDNCDAASNESDGDLDIGSDFEILDECDD